MVEQKCTKNLESFFDQAKKFESHTGFFQSIKAEMHFEAGHGARMVMSNINEEPLIAVMVHLRNFYMKSSGLYFPKVAESILSDNSLSEHHILTKKFLDVWNQLLSPETKGTGGISLKIESDLLSGKRNLDVWMNEGYLHVDQYDSGSNKGLDAIKSHYVFENLSKFSMVDLLQRLSRLIIGFNTQVVAEILTNPPQESRVA